VQLQHLPGDRREDFQAPGDVWVIFRTLAEERRKREIDPTLVSQSIFDKWFVFPNIALLLPIPVATAVLLMITGYAMFACRVFRRKSNALKC
jgi:hypothetical protein